MKKAIIIIPEGISGMDITTNEIHPIILINALNMAQKHFAQELIKMARQAVGDDPKEQEKFFDRLSKKYLGDNADSGKTFGLDDILGLN